MKVSRVRIAAEIGLTVALSAVLGMLTVWQMPQGGSISFVMLPLFVLALLRGPGVGLAAGAVYGIVDFMLKPYLFHPAQVVLDYPLAFAACGLAGIFAARFTALAGERRWGAAIRTAVLPGVVIGALGRYAAHVISGLVFFSSYAVEAGQAPLVYSLAYNSFVLISAAASFVVAAAVLPALQREMVGGER
jgi:thiamine transporter